MGSKSGNLPFFFVLFVSLWQIAASTLSAQVMTGPWVDESNRKIDALRKTDVRIIVLGADGKPLPGATVRIEQIRHDFTLGFVIGEAGLPAFDAESLVMRCFNAVSLERFTGWDTLQSGPDDEPDFQRVDALVDAAQRAGLAIRWGQMVSADAARNPAWLAELDNARMAAALDGFVRRVTDRYGARVDAFDLYTHSLDHDWLTRKLGDAVVRSLHHHARAAAPRAVIALQLENCLAETRLNRAIRHADAMRQKFIPFDAVSMPQRLGGLLSQRQLAHGLELLGDLGAPATVGPVEVGGSSDAAAAENVETLLRTLFAVEAVQGIYFAGLTPVDVADPSAALIDDAGASLPPGAVIDGLFHGAWWTDETVTADPLGNVYARVFTGTHRVSAALPDGRELAMTVRLSKSPPPGLAQHIVLLEPAKQ